MTKTNAFFHKSSIALALSFLAIGPVSGPAGAIDYVDQGPEWTIGARGQFYTQDQGARMLPLSWLKALKQSDGKPFLDDALTRYGYLPNESPSNIGGLPVGFSVSDTPTGSVVGMTCSACHTRQIDVDGKPYRIDGGPAIADFQTFLQDLDKAVLDVLATDTAFKTFAGAVLGATADDTAVAMLHADVTLWSVRFHTLMARALPKERPWGVARLDAMSMIFNRLTGLDLGPPPTYLIPENIAVADSPVRYPFLWNAPRQDFTQWPGFAQNGNDFFALSRNLGEVYGVFGAFHPHETKGSVALFDRNYIVENSANFEGLDTLEGLVKRIGPPAWSWPVDKTLAEKGKAVFDRHTAGDGTGGCVDCHGIQLGQPRPPNLITWKTPILNVGTDHREWRILTRYATSGSLKGASISGVVSPILDKDLAVTLLKISVVGAIGEYEAWKAGGDLGLRSRLAPSLAGPVAGMAGGPVPADAQGGVTMAGMATASTVSMQAMTTPMTQMDGAFHLPGMRAPMTLAPTASAEPAPYSYEARVLQGVWAAAPFLHNGSVPSLADLLKPAADRPKVFKIGPAYDIATVGLAAEQPGTASTLHATGCDDIDSGDSNCGHDYGTRLPDADKKALLEYLKTL